MTAGGRYSKYLPANLQTRYETAAADPNLLVMREDVALVDVRIASLLDKTTPDDPPDQAEWREIATQLDLRRRLVESERKRLVDLHQMVSATEARTLIIRLAAIVREHVKDRGALNAINIEFVALLGEQSNLQHDAGRLDRGTAGGSATGTDT